MVSIFLFTKAMVRCRNILFIALAIASFPVFSQSECEVSYVANEGFLFECEGKKIAVDVFFDHIDGDWCDSPSAETIELMKGARAPFDNIDLIAITHHHIDHFSEDIVADYLLSNKKTLVLCPKQVGEKLAVLPDYDKFSDRIISLTPAPLSDTNLIVSQIPVRIMRLEHSHYSELDSVSGEMVNRHRNVENLGFYFNIQGIGIFHCGDTNPFNEEEYAVFSLQENNIDIAFLERLFLRQGEAGRQIIEQYIQPEYIVFMHINPNNKKTFVDIFKHEEKVVIFAEPLSKHSFSFVR